MSKKCKEVKKEIKQELTEEEVSNILDENIDTALIEGTLGPAGNFRYILSNLSRYLFKLIIKL